jgi:hypothetical protein
VIKSSAAAMIPTGQNWKASLATLKVNFPLLNISIKYLFQLRVKTKRTYSGNGIRLVHKDEGAF